MLTRKAIEAQAQLKPAMDAIIAANGRCMEQVITRDGIVCERWMLPNGAELIAYGTPVHRDVFVPLVRSGFWADTTRAIAELAAKSASDVRTK